MTNSEFVCAFRNGTLTPSTFHHEQHLRLAYIHLSSGPLETAVESFRNDLQMFLSKLGEESKYHETITVAFLLIVKERMDQLEANHCWDEFRCEHADLFDPSRNMLLLHYRPETLHSEEARQSFVPPDIIPLPASFQFSRRIIPGVLNDFN